METKSLAGGIQTLQFRNKGFCRMLWHILLMWRLRQADLCGFKVSQGYIVRPSSKKGFKLQVIVSMSENRRYILFWIAGRFRR